MSAFRDYPELKLLFAGYFHEDWQSDDVDQEAVVRRFVTSESHDTVQRVLEQLQSVLASGLADAELRLLVASDLGSGYEPLVREGATEEWLRLLASQITATMWC